MEFDAFALGSQVLKRLTNRIKKLGGTYEGAYSSLIAIDVPPRVQLKKITDYLTKSGLEWEYADPTYDEMHAKKERS